MTMPNPPGHQVIAPGQTIASAWGNTVWDQSVQRFTSAADRNAQWATPHEGAVCWLDDVKRMQVYRSGAWAWLVPGAEEVVDIQCGVATLSTDAAGRISVDFPRLFVGRPAVFVQVDVGISIVEQIYQPDTHGFTFVAYDMDPKPVLNWGVTFSWIAVYDPSPAGGPPLGTLLPADGVEATPL